MIQTILIPKNKFSLKEAEKWIVKNKYKKSFYGKKVDITENYFRFRQESPLKFKNYYAKRLKNGIIIVSGRLK